MSTSRTATHMGPMLLGTVKDGAATKNLGAVSVYQLGNLSYANTSASPATIGVVPAGAFIAFINVDVLTTFNAGTSNLITVYIGSNAVATCNLTTTGRHATTYTTANMGTLVNTGTTDQPITVQYSSTGTAPSAGSAVVSLEYVVRNADGTYSRVP